MASQIDARIAALPNTCPLGSGAGQPAAPGGSAPQPGNAGGQPSAPAERRFAILGIGCTGATRETGKAGRVVCHAQTDNEPFDEPATFNWTLDNQPAGSGRRMAVNGVAQGEHAVTVVATSFRGEQRTYSGWVTVSDTGASTSNFGLSASCSYNRAQNSVTCHATPANAPANANLEYSWLWNGGFDASKAADMTVSVPNEYRTYTVQVRAIDRASSTNSAVASTSVTVGDPPIIPPAVGQAANGVLTGTANPSQPDPGAVAGGAVAVGLGLGLVALANGAVGAAAGGAKAVKPSVVQGAGQPASSSTGDKPSAQTEQPAVAPATAASADAQAGSGATQIAEAKPSPPPSSETASDASVPTSTTADAKQPAYVMDSVIPVGDQVLQAGTKQPAYVMDSVIPVGDNAIRANAIGTLQNRIRDLEADRRVLSHKTSRLSRSDFHGKGQAGAIIL